MARERAEWSNKLSIFWLKKHGHLERGWRYGGIQWTYGLSESKNSINFYTSIDQEEDDNIRLVYTNTNHWTGEKEKMDYRIELASTPCNYGGKRYWFICPLSKNGQYCGRRVGVLYSVGKWFGCRHCGEIAYDAQFQGGRFRMGSVSEPDVEKAYNEIKREYYNGKPTRKYKRYLRLRQKMDYSWIRMLSRFGDKF